MSEREKYWIKYYNSTDRDYGYNLTDGGEGHSGYCFTDEQRDNLYLKHKDKSDEIIQLSLDGSYIRRWRSSANAARKLGIPVSGIRNCILDDGDQYICHGYIWVLAKKYDNGQFDYNDYKEKYLWYYFKPISQYDLYGNIINHWNNQLDFSKSNPKLNKVIKRLLTLELRSYNGFIYIYDDNIDVLTNDYLRDCRVKSKRYKIKQFDLEYNYLRSYTIDELDELPYRTQTILKCCSNRYAHTRNGLSKAFGYIWEYD